MSYIFVPVTTGFMNQEDLQEVLLCCLKFLLCFSQLTCFKFTVCWANLLVSCPWLPWSCAEGQACSVKAGSYPKIKLQFTTIKNLLSNTTGSQSLTEVLRWWFQKGKGAVQELAEVISGILVEAHLLINYIIFLHFTAIQWNSCFLA